MYRRILIPLDGSPVAEAALEVASGMLEPQNGRLLLVRMQEQSEESRNSELGPVAKAYDLEHGRCESYLNIVRERWQTPERPVCVEVLQHHHRTSMVINEAATRLECDLVVMTSHGRSGLERGLLGSVAEELARRCNRPVVIVGPQSTEVQRIKQDIREMSNGNG